MSTVYAQIAKRLPTPIFKLGAQAFIKKDFPRHIFLETTAKCNLSCSYCPRERESSHMDFGLLRKIVDEAHRYGPRSFSLHLFGEPLLYPRIFEAVRYIKKRNPRNTVLLTTNGTILNECVEDFVSCGISQAYWTWRREAKFTEATLLKLRTWGKFRVRFIDGITPDEAREEWKDWKNTENRRMHDYASGIDTSRFKIGTKKVIDKKPNVRWPCYHLFYAPAVAWNGKFLLCCADAKQSEVWGDIDNETVSDCWKKIESVRQAHLKGEFNGICGKCDVWREVPNVFFGHEFTQKSY